MKRPTVFVSGPASRGRTAWLFTRHALRRAGAIPQRIRPSTSQVGTADFDALVLGGGCSVSPDLYGQQSQAPNRYDEARDVLELRLLAEALAGNKPVLGICRGAQLMNVSRGGTLHQSLKSVFDAHDPRRRLRARKRITLVRNSRLAQALGHHQVRVNSIHEQGIALLGKDVAVTARDDLEVVQGIELENYDGFCVGVQWHPEYMPTFGAQRKLFSSFVQAARGHRT